MDSMWPQQCSNIVAETLDQVRCRGLKSCHVTHLQLHTQGIAPTVVRLDIGSLLDNRLQIGRLAYHQMNDAAINCGLYMNKYSK